MTDTISIAANRPQIWLKELWKDVIDGMYFTQMNMMGKGENNVIQILDDLKKSPGDRIHLPFTSKLSGDGITGDSALEGNEEAISAYAESVLIDQIRNAVRLTGKLDEKKNSYNMRMDAKNKLSIWMQEFIERQMFLKLAGVQITDLTDVNGVTVGGRALWSNTADAIPDADVAAGVGARYLCANAGGADVLATTDLMTPALISRLRAKAAQTNPKIRPIKVGGKNYYVLFIHPNQAYDLKTNSVFVQAQREAQVRGNDNPIFTGALGIWDSVIVHEHEYVPFLDVTAVATPEFAGGTTVHAVDTYRAILCGQQAAVMAKAVDKDGMVEETFDYKNKVGFAVSFTGGIQKVMFNSLEYATIALDTYATPVN